MSQRKGIYWIASFPKSGNTWTRILLSNLTGASDDEDENPFKLGLTKGISSDRSQFDDIVGLPSSDLSADETDLYRPDLYCEAAREADSPLFIKVHDGYHLNSAGKPLFPASCSLGVIYIVRDPMDVAVSYSHHSGAKTYDRAVKRVNGETGAASGNHNRQLRQQMLGWDQHFRSWNDQDAIPVLTISYEQLLEDTHDCLYRMANFANLPEADDPDKIARAVEMSRFDNLRRAEDAKGFREKPEKAERFFRSGRSGEGREKLGTDLQQAITEKNRELMLELSYL